MRVQRAVIAMCWIPAFALLMSGCSAADEVGVRLDHRGVLTVVNCGTWMVRVTASDADSGRRVWSAHALKDSSGEPAGEAYVAIGELPATDWVEDTHEVTLPRPSTWRFSVHAESDVTVVASEAALRSGRMFRPGRNKSETSTHFTDQTCTGLPISARAALLLLATVLLVCGGITILVVIAYRRRSRNAFGRA